jgi:hypothetical protein
MQNGNITIKNRLYTLLEVEPITNYPALAQGRTDVESHFIAEGKKGALVSGYILKDGSLIIF